MAMDDRELIERAVTLDLFGLDGESEDDLPAAPAKYRLQRLIGKGGFGSVYLATDTMLERNVALKFLTNARAADLERFRREARFTARLQNPSIVQIYEFGEAEGAWYIAMQFVDGTHLGEARLQQPEVIRIFQTIARALGHAHREGIVHRDIKPENILLDRQGRSFITDFGIARDLMQRADLTLSQAGTIIGTPAFMAPEQARGELDAVDARSDVYSLGATLYRTLTGHRPFDGGNLAAVLHAVVYDEPRLPRSLDASIPRHLESVVMRCLRKQPADRFASMEEVAAALADPPGHSESRDWFRRLVGVPPREAPRELRPDHRDPLREAVAREIYAAETDLYRASTVTRCFDRLHGVIARLDAVIREQPDAVWARLYRGMAHFRRDRLNDALDDMERAIDRVGDVASAHFELGRLYLALYLRELQIARTHVTAEGVHEHLKSTRGRLGQAAIAFEEALRIQRDLPDWQLRFVRAVTALANGDHDQCIADCDEILEDEPDREEVWKLRGDAAQLCGRDAIDSYDAALKIRRTYYEACYSKAEALYKAGLLEPATAALRHAVTIHPGFADGWSLLGRIALVAAHRSEDALLAALEPLDRALQIEPMHYEATVTRAEVLSALAAFPERGSSLDEALTLLETAKRLPGCRNRVNIMTAQVRLRRAERAAARGADPRTDLEAVLAYREEMRTHARHQPHDLRNMHPWPELWLEAERRLAALA